MPALTLPAGFPLPGLITELAPGDTMFDGRDWHYLRVGVSALDAIEAALSGAAAPRRILDLPCGFGRVTRMLRARYPAAEITVCDLDRPAVDFAAATFDARGVYSTPDFRDLRIDGPFDLIWVGSLLTHLPEHQTRQFLDFAARHMAPDARLVVTSHGDYVAARLRASTYGLSEAAARGLIAQYLACGYGYRGYGGDPAYGISLAARAWYETLLAGSPLRLQSFRPRGWDRHQDVLVLRPAPAGGSSRPTPLDRPGLARPLPAAEQERQDASAVAGFDEAWYCATSPDVEAAVRDGSLASGLEHYLLYGWREGRPPFDPALSYAARTPPTPAAWVDGVVGNANRVDEAWSVSPEEQAEDVGWYWMAHPAVRLRANLLASGDAGQDAYDRLAALLRLRGWTLPIGRSVSIGCGFGALERDLSSRGLVREVDAYDIASGAVLEAERQARRLGLLRLRYHVADLETIDLPPASVDVVFAHSSVHHVERLEALYAVVARTLRPGGVFHLHEYVGPTRFQWTDAQLELANAFLDGLPERLRRQPDGNPKPRLRRPTIEEMIAADPSEAVRSAELVETLAPYFDIVEQRPLGGALAHIALGGIAQNFDPASPEDDAILRHLFATEDAAMADGVIGSDFATIVAMPKPAAVWPVSSKAPRNLARGHVSAMPSSLAARAAALFPPARRLHDAINHLNAAVGAMQAHQDRMTDEIATLRRQSATPPVSIPTPAPTAKADAGPGADADVEAILDRATRRELGEAALRHLPFLPGEFEVATDGVTVTGYCGAPEGITGQMAFFINGERIDEVEYPIVDPELKSRFPDVPGMGLVFRLRVGRNLAALHAARFWRFDAAPTGRYNPADWRRAVHYMNPAQERFAFPPVPNIQRVIGDTSVERFAMGGAIIFNNVGHLLRELGHDWNDFPRILDWGCGAGRLTRYLIGETSSAVTGVDIDADNIDWCRRTYAGGSFTTVPLRPPSALPAGQFDLVFGLSVLTHLQEADQFLWLAELQRLTRPGALLLLSVQGPTQFAYNKFPPHLFRKLQVDGYIDLSRDPALDGVVADTEYYRAAMHSRAYIVRRWGEFFDVLAFADAIAGLQDFVVLRRRGYSALSTPCFKQ